MGIFVASLKYIMVGAFIVLYSVSSFANSELKIALYEDRGVWDDSITAVTNLLNWMGYSPYKIDAGLIDRGDLDNYDLLFIPSCDMFNIAEDISDKGKENIREFISEGGGYVGICGGAYFAGNKIMWGGKEIKDDPLLEIFAGTTVGIIDEIAPYPKYDMCTVNITDMEHPITAGKGESMRILYYWGPAMIPDTGADVSILGRYEANDEAAIVAFDYGNGRVFIIGPIPEIEEDSDRDGADFGEGFNDEESDWHLVRDAVLWCLRR